MDVESILEYQQIERENALNKHNSRLERDEKKDMKNTVDLLYAFRDKLLKLHPACANYVKFIINSEDFI